MCVPDVVNNLNVKVFNLVPGTNETRRIEWHETCKCKCRFEQSVCNNKQRWNDDRCRWKELIDKGVCDKGFIWSPSNCECECNKSCEFSEYFDYKKSKCRKRLENKLIDKCNETIDEVKLTKITIAENENSYKHKFCILYIVLFSIFFIISVVIGAYFVHYKYMNRNKINVSKYCDYVYQTTI